MSTDTLTVLRCAPQLRLCKVVRADGTITAYDSARHLDAAEVAVEGLDGLRDHLARLLAMPRCCVIRGALIAGPRARGIRRLLYADRDTGAPATLRDVPRRWVALDMDGIEAPGGLDLSDLAECAEVAVERLPAAFRDARCLAQASASHGLKAGLRLRLWFWLDRAVSGVELGRWLRGSPADPAVFRAAQPIYTAAPLFEPGAKDPVPRRLLELPGEEQVAVPAPGMLDPPKPRPLPPVPAASDSGAARYAARAMTNAILRVASAPTANRHPTCISEARGLGRLVVAGLLSAEQVKAGLAGALAQAGKTELEGLRAAQWGLDHPRGGALPEGGR